MNIKYFLTLCCFMSLVACAHKTETPEPQTQTKEQAWDYDQVRKTRSAEADQESLRPQATGPEATLDCVMMSGIQKSQSRASGCKKMDPRLGYGEDTYCCERE